MPFFSIITPVYNRAKLLPETINTVLNQEFTDFEYILVDDKSTDSSLQVLKEYAAKDPRIKIVSLEENQGRCIARNKGAEAASANWICYLDSDDFYFSNHLSTLKKMIEENPDFKAFATEQTWDKQPKKYNKKRFYKDKVVFQFEDFIDANPISPNQLCYHKSVGVHWVNERLPISEDWLFHRQLALKTPILKYNILTTDVRIHDQRSLDTASTDTFVQWNMHATKRFIELEPNLPVKYKNTIESFINLLVANIYLSQKRKKDAMKYFVESLSYLQSYKNPLLYKAIIKFLKP
ncbi:MAG: glycosyltransferase family 2 protein [Bacteroidetes bacterium]|nr:glycosyltransferase family 2 protein [Bacteroidota bacterium]